MSGGSEEEESSDDDEVPLAVPLDGMVCATDTSPLSLPCRPVHCRARQLPFESHTHTHTHTHTHNASERDRSCLTRLTWNRCCCYCCSFARPVQHHLQVDCGPTLEQC